MYSIHKKLSALSVLRVKFCQRCMCVETDKEWGLKQVTKTDFKSVIDEVKQHIHNADFISVSLQSTGSYGAPWRRILPLDTCETAYYKAKDSAERFQLLQFAVCPFKLADSKVIAFPYNFHLFPRDELRVGLPSYNFSCQLSSLTSMAQQGFDFNACVYDGISYLSRAQEKTVKQLGGRSRMLGTYPVVSCQNPTTADTIFMERIRSRVRHWRDTCLGSSENPKDGLLYSLKAIVLNIEMFGSRPCMRINASSDRQVQLILEVLKEFSHNLVPLTSPAGDDMQKEVKVFFTSSEDDKYLLLNELQRHEEDQNKQLLGFREVVETLITSGKPVVGYHCLTDFTVIYSKFIAPLPPNVEEFMCSLHNVFPFVLDINHLLIEAATGELIPMKAVKTLHAALSYLKRQFSLPLNMEVPPDFKRFGSRGAESHGYAVLRITYVFAKLCRLLKVNSSDFISSSNGCGEGHANILFPSGTFLKKSACNRGIVKLEEESSHAENSNIIFLWGFKNGSSAKDILQMLYSVHEICQAGIKVQLVDESCAYVKFERSKSAEIFLQYMQSGMNSVGFAESKPLEEITSRGMRAIGYNAYKKLCKSSLWEKQLADSFELVTSDFEGDLPHTSTTDLTSRKHDALILELGDL